MLQSRIWQCIFAVALLAASSSSARVHEFTDDFLNRSPEKHFLIKFYAPWCGHCRNMEPAYAEVANLLSNTDVTVGRIDATAYQAVAAEFRIRGFPTLMFISGENKVEYRGERSAQEILKFVNRVSGEPVRNIASPGKFADALETGKTDPFFLFVGNQQSDEFSVYNYIAGQMRAEGNFYRAESELLSRLPASIESMRLEPEPMPLTEPAVLVFKESGCLLFPGKFTNDSLGVWINDERHQIFPKIGDFLFYTFYPTTKLIMVLITNATDKAGSEAFVNTGRQLATSMRPDLASVQFAWSESVKAASDLAMTSLPTPNVIIMNTNTSKYYLRPDYNKPVTGATVESLGQLAADAMADRLPSYGGNGIIDGIKRAAYDFATGLVSFIIGHPGLALVVIGAPIGVVSILCYAICCMDSDADEDALALEEEEEEEFEREEEAIGDSAETEGAAEGKKEK